MFQPLHEMEGAATLRILYKFQYPHSHAQDTVVFILQKVDRTLTSHLFTISGWKELWSMDFASKETIPKMQEVVTKILT